MQIEYFAFIIAFLFVLIAAFGMLIKMLDLDEELKRKEQQIKSFNDKIKDMAENKAVCVKTAYHNGYCNGRDGK